MFSSTQIAVAAAIIGHLSHVTYFVKGERLLDGPRIFLVAVAAPSVLTSTFIFGLGFTMSAAIWTTTVLYSSFLAGLFFSIAVYRIFFHPLKNYPGPFMRRLTQWTHVVSVGDRLDNYKRIHELHEKYGDYVRVGPNLLSIANPAIVDVAHETKSKFKKSVWYHVGFPMTSMHQMRDVKMHDKRRRDWWQKAFTTASVRQYEPTVLHHADLLVKQMKARTGSVVDITEWINFFTFDIMGQLSFGRSFDNLENAESHKFVKLMHENGKPLGLLGTVSWILHLAINLPAAVNPMVEMINYSEKMVDDRINSKTSEPDVMSHILEPGPFFDDPAIEKQLLTGDARLLIIAGADTTATTLAFFVYYLVKYPLIMKKLREELDQHNVRNDDSFDCAGLQHLPYLNALINETLRMHPPVPGGVYRDPPAEGITFDGNYLAPSINVVTPNYTIQRSPRAFAKPNEFIPERWTTQPDLVLDKTAFFPFLLGRYGCIGKQVALIELRALLAKIALSFDIQFAPGETGKRLVEDSYDIFTTTALPLKVIFTERK